MFAMIDCICRSFLASCIFSLFVLHKYDFINELWLSACFSVAKHRSESVAGRT